MADFEAAIAAQLDGSVYRIARLVHFDFLTTPVRLWEGFGDLVANGYTWKGTSGVGSMSTAGTGQQIVEEMTFSLAGTAEMLDRADEDADALETIGRDVEVFIQFLDANYAPLGDPMLYFWGTMGPITAGRSEADDNGIVQFTASVTAQNVMKNYGRPPLGTFSDEDVRARSTDGTDAIASRVSDLVEGSVIWPTF